MENTKYMEYRFKKIKEHIEFIGAFEKLDQSEKDEYKRLFNYFKSMKEDK